MNIFPKSMLAIAFALLNAGVLQAATLAITFDEVSSSFDANNAHLTLRFASDTDNQTTFGQADFFDRQWDDVSDTGSNTFGAYPTSNFDNTTIAISGFVTNAGNILRGFRFTKTSNTGFVPIDLQYSLRNRLRGPMLWFPLNGAVYNFQVSTIAYDALGTDFAPVDPNTGTGGGLVVPMPASLPLTLFGLAASLGLRRRKMRVAL